MAFWSVAIPKQWDCPCLRLANQARPNAPIANAIVETLCGISWCNSNWPGSMQIDTISIYLKFSQGSNAPQSSLWLRRGQSPRTLRISFKEWSQKQSNYSPSEVFKEPLSTTLLEVVLNGFGQNSMDDQQQSITQIHELGIQRCPHHQATTPSIAPSKTVEVNFSMTWSQHDA